MFLELLAKHLAPDHCVTEWQGKRLEAHFDLLERWNKRLNLTAIRDREELILQHYCESIALAAILPQGKLRIMDVGSGAGFPGVPLAICRPESSLLLVEGDARKAVFLREATLELMNCTVIRSRLNQVQQSADWIVSRAVRWQDIVEEVPGRAQHVALMITGRTASEVCAHGALRWREPIAVRWGDRKVVLIGDVPRETLTKCFT